MLLIVSKDTLNDAGIDLLPLSTLRTISEFLLLYTLPIALILTYSLALFCLFSTLKYPPDLYLL